MKAAIISLLISVLLLSSVRSRDLTPTDARSVAEAIQSGNWNIYIIYFYWNGLEGTNELESGLTSKVTSKYPDAYYAKLDCSSSDYHTVLDLFEFQDSRDNFKGRSIHLEILL